MSRQCGGCKVCCRVLAVPGLDKQKGHHCHHESTAGCAIYKKGRPPECLTFKCLWLRDDESLIARLPDRPDKTGVMLVGPVKSEFTKRTGIPVIFAYENNLGDFERYQGDKLIKRINKKHLVLLIRGEARVFLGPAPLVEVAKKFVHAVIAGGT